MGYQLPNLPRFMATAFQGLAYWMGYRASYFPSYPLPEAALVSEACGLLQANLGKDLRLCPEVLYRRLAKIEGGNPGRQSRADLVIVSGDSPDPYKNDVSRYVRFAIEVKRGSASESLINDDLRRLLALKRATGNDVRAFLVIASEAHLPERFVVDAGHSRLHPHQIPGTKGAYYVRRTVKAAPSFQRTGSAHYVCMVEVFAEARPKS